MNFQLLNQLDQDPVVRVASPLSGEVGLFDLGSLDQVSFHELTKVSFVCVSHTHIDHFIGFDRLLRSQVPHGFRWKLFGPPGFIDNVSGKMQGYCWNLLTKEHMHLEVTEIDPAGALRKAHLEQERHFKPRYVEPVNSTLLAEHDLTRPPHMRCLDTLKDGTRIWATALDHRTPSIAYALQSAPRYKTDPLALKQMGIKPGPWVGELQSALLAGKKPTRVKVETTAPETPDSPHPAQKSVEVDLVVRRAMQLERTTHLAYATDLLFSRDNVERLSQLSQGANTLICESNFCSANRAKAARKAHLTTYQAALIAAISGVKELQNFHFSKIYRDTETDLRHEATGYFKELTSHNIEKIQSLVHEEIGHIETELGMSR